MEGKIYEAIPKIMAEIGAIGKNQRNTQQNFMFRGIDAVMNGINPALIKHGVFIVPEVMEQTREERTTAKGSKLIYSICKIKFSFCAEDGSHVDAITIGEGMDSGDKATNKAMLAVLNLSTLAAPRNIKISQFLNGIGEDRNTEWTIIVYGVIHRHLEVGK